MIILRKKIHLILGFLICILFICYQSAIIVPEGQIGLLLSKELTPYPGSILKSGLHFKIPFFMQSILLDNRLQTLAFNEVSAENNSPQKSITNEYFANWRITDPIRYYQQTKNNFQLIKSLISQEITSLLNDKKTSKPFSQLILNGSPEQIDSVLSAANKQFKMMGIKLVTMGFKQLDLSVDTNARILDNMSIEQENIAIAQRAQGKANAELIRASADNSARLILAKAKEQAAKIRAQGDAEAAKIYNQAYNKNPEFAAFYLNLEAYQQGLKPSSMDNLLLIKTKDEHFKPEKAHINTNMFKLTN